MHLIFMVEFFLLQMGMWRDFVYPVSTSNYFLDIIFHINIGIK